MPAARSSSGTRCTTATRACSTTSSRPPADTTDRPSASATHLPQEVGRTRASSDELDYYLEDGLLDFLRISPDRWLDRGRRRQEAELLQVRSRQFQDLLRETVRLATYAEDAVEVTGRRWRDGQVSADPRGMVVAGSGSKVGCARFAGSSARL